MWLQGTSPHSISLGVIFWFLFLQNLPAHPSENCQKHLLFQKIGPCILIWWERLFQEAPLMTLEQCPGGREWMGMIWSTGTGNDYNDNDDDNELVHWYRSSETISGMTPYGLHVANKKWPLKKVFTWFIFFCLYIYYNFEIWSLHSSRVAYSFAKRFVKRRNNNRWHELFLSRLKSSLSSNFSFELWHNDMLPVEHLPSWLICHLV